MISTSHLLTILVGVLTISHSAIANPPSTPPAPSRELTHVRGTYVSLAVPEGFTPTPRFPGFIHAETGAIIYVTEGFSLESKLDLTEERSSIGGVPVMHWKRTLRSEYSGNQVTIGAVAPEAATVPLAAPLTEALRSVQLDPPRDIPLMEPTSTLQLTPGFQEIKHQPSTSSWQGRSYSAGDSYLEDPASTLSVRFEPACLLMPPADMSLEEAKSLLEQRFSAEMGEEPAFEAHSVTPVKVDGLHGWELVYRLKENRPNMSIYQMLLREGFGCYKVSGYFGRNSEHNLVLDRFKAAARSFKRLDAPVFTPPASEKDFLGLTQVRGTRLFMAVPPGFVESKQFVGFTEERSGAFIQITPGMIDPFPDFPMVPPSKTTLWGIPHRRMLREVHDATEKAELYIAATFREKDAARLSEPVTRALDSIRVKRSAEIVRPERNFKLTPMDGMEEYGLAGPPEPGKPERSSLRALARVMVHRYRYIKHDGPAFDAAFRLAGSRIPFAKLNKASAKRFFEKHLGDFSDPFRIESTSPIELDGVRGWEIIAIAGKSNEPGGLVLYQVILPEGAGFYCLRSTFSKRHRKEYLPLAKTMARTFKRL